ncbi:uncharacterized protein [Coffea arabica]|uniref:Uncharacterized protein n=1 Tax=Coffea arabica TaxID=13443 RepID=A0A6P6W609_COFAR|nr:uncharacterized protein LOC113729554 [Coffea arabica]
MSSSSGSSQLRNLFYSIEDELLSGEMFYELPPESFWVPNGQEKDWVDHHAVMQRKSSMKLSSVGPSNHHSQSFSRRFSPSVNQKSIASLIGFPMTPKSGSADRNIRQNKAGNARLFRSLSEPGGKASVAAPEPGSPKVSCTGRVEKEKGRAKKAWFWSSFKTILRSGFGASLLASKGKGVSP